MRQLIAGNWKMNGSRISATELITAVRDSAESAACDVLLCPSFLHIGLAASLLDGSTVHLGGQDCHAQPDGAHTGDVSASMLRDSGAAWVILGHSERRQNHHETSGQVRAKVFAALQAGLRPIVAIGETEADHRARRRNQILGAQLAGSLPDGFDGVVAYEPIWAIGTGKTPDANAIAESMAFIRATLEERFPETGSATRILYGGSVTPDNAASLLALPNVGGALVGGASLKADQFLKIIAAAQTQ